MNKYLKILKLIALMLVAAMPSAKAEETKEGRSFDPNLVVFAGELRNYIEQARELSDIPEDKADQRNKLIAELRSTGRRVGKIYFKEGTEVIHNELNKNLQKVLKENGALKNYFVFLGNSFAEEAAVLLQIYKNKQRQTKTYMTLGGVGLGVLVGGGYIFFKLRSSPVAIGLSGLAAKDFGIAAGAVAAGTAVGFGAGTIYSGRLPMDSSVQNAKDFSTRYPHGEDFINHLDRGSDLKLMMSVLSN